MWSSIQASSISSSSGVNARAPSTPRPPARLTAATTSRQCEKAKSGNSIPNLSQTGARTRRPPRPNLTGRQVGGYGAARGLTTAGPEGLSGVRDPDERGDRRDQRAARRDDGDL